MSKASRGRFSLLPEVSFRGVAGGSIDGSTSFCVDLVEASGFSDAIEGAFVFLFAPFGLAMVVAVLSEFVAAEIGG